MRSSLFLSLSVLAACGGASGGGDVSPVESSGQAIRSFMQAASDSNLTRMSQLWGTSAGSAATTRKPDGWEKRLVVLQLYLKGDSAKLVSDVPVTGKDDQRQVLVALYRGTCVKQIPATLTRSRGGWLVDNVDLAAAGSPARPCEP